MKFNIVQQSVNIVLKLFSDSVILCDSQFCLRYSPASFSVMDSSTTSSSVIELVKKILSDKDKFFGESLNKIVEREVRKETAYNFPDLRRTPNNCSRCLSELLEGWKEIVSQDMSDIPASDILESNVFDEFIEEKDSSYERMDIDKIAENSVLFKEHFEFNAFKKMFISMKKNEPEKLKELIIENTKKIHQNLIDVFTAIDESGIV